MNLFKKLFTVAKGRNSTIAMGNIPRHIAVIPDGNGRWAKKRSMPRSVGHRAGSNTLKKIVIYCDKIGVKYLTVFAFSTENWLRPKEEVDGLMSLLLDYLKNAENELKGTQVRIRVIGDITKMPREFSVEIPRVERLTKNNKGMNLIFALNYGGRDEITHAVKGIVKDVQGKKLREEDIDEALIGRYMYTRDIPDPDLIIRTSGESRISNFLLWQSAYTELLFSQVLWPDFSEKDMAEAIEIYKKRHRRFGGI